MGKEFDNTNSGALFGNQNKREGKKDPDLQGKINVGGVEYWLSAWFKKYDKDGETKQMISLSIGDVVGQKGGPATKPQSKKGAGAFAGMDDDVPFAPIGRGIAGHAE